MTLEQIIAIVEGVSGQASQISVNDRIVMCSDTSPPVALLHDPKQAKPYCVIVVAPDEMGRVFSTCERAMACYMSHVSKLESNSA